MPNSKDFTTKDIQSRFNITCPVGITITCNQDVSDSIAERAIRNYIEFHLASEEKIAAADSFWQKFHTYISEAKDNQKNSEEFLEWKDAIERLNICKSDFLDMKQTLGLTVHYIVEAKAA